MRAAIALFAAISLLGCSSRGSADADDPSDLASVLSRTERATLVPRGSGAEVYRSDPAARRQLDMFQDELVLTIFRAIRDAAADNRIRVLPDERLDAVVGDLARSLAEGEQPRSDAVEFLLAHYGVVEPYPELRVLRVRAGVADDEVAARILGAFRLPGLSPMVTLGIGVNRATSELVVVLATQAKLVDLEPVARVQPSGATIRLAGTLLGEFAAPSVYVTYPDGRATRHPLAVDGNRFAAEVACDGGDGRYQLEVFGQNDGGPKVLANFPVFCGADPPTDHDAGAGYVPGDVTAEQSEARLLALVNEARAGAGLAAVEPDPALAEVARAHARDMVDNDYFGHVSPTTGSPADRVRRAGITLPRPRLLENIGKAGTPDEVHRGLMRSPGHRSAILDPKITHAGIGVVIDRHADGSFDVVATELFR